MVAENEVLVDCFVDKAQKRLTAFETTKCDLPEDMQPGTSIISLQQSLAKEDAAASKS